MKRSAASTVALVVAVVLVVVVIAAIAIVGFGTDGATAVEVGDTKISRESINDRLRAVADNDLVIETYGADRISGSPGTLTSEAATQLVLTGVVTNALLDRYLEAQGERVTAQDRDDAETLFPSTAIGTFADDFPDWYRDEAIDQLAAFVAFGRVRGIDITDSESNDEITRALRRTAARVGVKVDPRYGCFRPSSVAVAPYPSAARLLDSGCPGSSSASG